MLKIPKEFSLFFELVNASLIYSISIAVRFSKYLKVYQGIVNNEKYFKDEMEGIQFINHGHRLYIEILVTVFLTA